MRNIKIADADYEKSIQEYKMLADDIAKRIDIYIRSLNELTTQAVKSGAVFNSLCIFENSAANLKGVLENALKDYSDTLLEFINKVKSTDNYNF